MKRIAIICIILAVTPLADMIAARAATIALDFYKERISASYCAEHHRKCSFPGETCSQYAKHAIQRYGFFIGGCKAYKRLFDCARAGRVSVAAQEDLLKAENGPDAGRERNKEE